MKFPFLKTILSGQTYLSFLFLFVVLFCCRHDIAAIFSVANESVFYSINSLQENGATITYSFFEKRGLVYALQPYTTYLRSGFELDFYHLDQLFVWKTSLSEYINSFYAVNYFKVILGVASEVPSQSRCEWMFSCMWSWLSSIWGWIVGSPNTGTGEYPYGVFVDELNKKWSVPNDSPRSNNTEVDLNLVSEFVYTGYSIVWYAPEMIKSCSKHWGGYDFLDNAFGKGWIDPCRDIFVLSTYFQMCITLPFEYYFGNIAEVVKDKKAMDLLFFSPESPTVTLLSWFGLFIKSQILLDMQDGVFMRRLFPDAFFIPFLFIRLHLY